MSIMSSPLLLKTVLEKLSEAGLLDTGTLAMQTLAELLDTADLVMEDVINKGGGMLEGVAERMVELDSEEADFLRLLWDHLQPLHSGAVRTFRLQSSQRLQELEIENQNQSMYQPRILVWRLPSLSIWPALTVIRRST